MPLAAGPIIFLAQGFQRRDALLDVGDKRARTGNATGLILSWDDLPDRGVRDDAARAAWPAVLALDPGGHRYGRPTIGRGANAATAPWIARAAPTTNAQWDTTVAEALGRQRQLRPGLLIIPSVELSAPDWPDGLERALNAARRAYRNRDRADPDMLVRVCVRDEWVSDDRRRRTLLTELTDLPDELGVALHVRWARSDILDDGAAIGRLRQCVTALASDNRPVLVLQSGLLGWLSIAWGAWGFGAGLSQAAWHDHTQITRRAAGQPAPRVEWFFERSLLHRFRRADLQVLAAQHGYNPCGCAYCQRLQPLGGGPWDAAAADQHALRALAELTSQVAAPTLAGRRQRVHAVIDQAQARWSQVSGAAGLSRDARPTHLPIWLQHV